MEIAGASPSMLVAPSADPRRRWWRLRVKGVPSVRFRDRAGYLAASLEARHPGGTPSILHP